MPVSKLHSITSFIKIIHIYGSATEIVRGIDFGRVVLGMNTFEED